MKFAANPAERLAALAMPAARAAALMALDRASARRMDQDGHLFVADCNLSAAGVSSYRAEEVPGWQALGLKPGQAVRLLRPAEELARAAPSFAGKPLLLVHKPVLADAHPHSLVVGAVAHDVRFEDPWLRGSLTVWDGEAIAAIKDGSQRDLSCGYRYEIDPTPGTYQGEPFQFRMVNLAANHIAIVQAGRVPGCFVGDAAIKLKGKFVDDTELDDGIKSQLKSYLQALLSPDAMADVEKILAGQSVPNPEMAGDAAARQVARRFVADQRAREDAAFVQRFPDAARLRS